MERGIRAVAPGRKLNVIGRVIESYAKRFGYGVVRDFTGTASVRPSIAVCTSLRPSGAG